MGRNTSTGKDAEKTIEQALKRGGYEFTSQKIFKNIKPNHKNYYIDFYLERDSRRIGVELKWQQSSGTAEEKIPYALICLLILVEKNLIDKGYLVLGGSDYDKEKKRKGWTLRNYYISDGLQTYIDYKDKVEIVNIDTFQADANQANL